MKRNASKICAFWYVVMTVTSIGFLCPSGLSAQSYKEWVRSGNRFLQQGDYASAVHSFQQAVTMKPDDPEVQWSLGEAAREARDYKAAVEAYGVVSRLAQGSRQRTAILYRALMHKQTGNLDGWETALKEFNENPANLSEEIMDHAASEIASVEIVRKIAHIDSIQWIVKNAGDLINSDFAELRPWPMDDTTLVFGSSLPVGEEDDDPDAQLFRLYQSNRTLKGFEKPRILDKRLNQEDMHTANPAFNADGTKMYFTVCYMGKGSPGLCDIWVSERSRGRWSRTRMLDDPINIKGYTSTHPAPAKHGNQEVLYFVSDRPGGSGGLDIWYSVITKGVPGSPINAGKPVNTPGNEVTPYYDMVKEGLYFSSDRHPGLGGWDVFFSKGGMSKWEAPLNQGMEVNSPAEDFGYIPPAPDNPGYLVSNRPGSRTMGEETCCFDIYLAEVMVKKAKEKDPLAQKTVQENQERASRINTVLPLSLFFDNDQPDPRSTSESTFSTYSSTLEAYLKRVPEYKKQYSTGLSGMKAKQASDSISAFFDQEVLPAKERMETLMGMLLETLKEGRDVELVVRGYASPLNTPAYNKILAARRTKSLVNEIQQWNKGILKFYMEAASDRPSLSIHEVPVGEVTHDGMISANPSDVRNSIYSPEAARARRITILYGKVEGVVGKTASGISTMRFIDKINIPVIPIGQHHLSILTFENTGTYPLQIDSTEVSDERIQVLVQEALVSPGKRAEVFLKVEGPWNPEEDKCVITLLGNLPSGKYVLAE